MSYNRQKSRLYFYLVLLLVTLLLGTLGFMLVEQRSFEDSLYFTVVTIATVGYGDIAPATAIGKALAMLLIVLGVGTFLGVVANSTEMFLSRREEKSRRQKMHMLIGLFFSEVGNELLRCFACHDQQLADLGEAVSVTEGWGEKDYRQLAFSFQGHPFRVAEDIPLKQLDVYLKDHGDLLIRLLENPYTLEHESATDMLLAVLHLKEELQHRGSLDDLPLTDLQHLCVDMSRAYGLMARQWVDYLRHLQEHYPFLYSLARRTNPFNAQSTSIVY